MLKGLLKFLPIETILGYFFPDTLQKFHIWQEAKTPENTVALGEAAANEITGHFAPDVAPVLAHYEQVANPAIESLIAAIELPNVKSIEVAVIEVGKVLASVLNSKATPDEIEAAGVAFANVLNKELGE